jgi:uncharacterized protein (TIGR02118 family)
MSVLGDFEDARTVAGRSSNRWRSRPAAEIKCVRSNDEIEKGVNRPYVAAVHLRFESLEAVQAAMSGTATSDVTADVANYTTITPVIQTSEIV